MYYNTTGERAYPIKGLEGYYSITKSGKVFSEPRDNVPNKYSKKRNEIKICISSNGYCYFKAWINNKSKHISLHRALAKTFIPNPLNKPYINHKDGNKANNSLSNLEWVTPKENSVHAWNMGLYKYTPKYWQGKFGKDHCQSKPIIQFDTEMNEIARFDSTASAVRATEIPRGSIKNALRKGCKGYGFYWKFVLK